MRSENSHRKGPTGYTLSPYYLKAVIGMSDADLYARSPCPEIHILAAVQRFKAKNGTNPTLYSPGIPDYLDEREQRTVLADSWKDLNAIIAEDYAHGYSRIKNLQQMILLFSGGEHLGSRCAHP